jgi:hypothetical protein
MSALRDPAIKLFGKTIPLPLKQRTCANELCGAEDRFDQNILSSTTSSREENSGREGAGQEGDQVCKALPCIEFVYHIYIIYAFCYLQFSDQPHFSEARKFYWVGLVSQDFRICGVNFVLVCNSKRNPFFRNPRISNGWLGYLLT